MIKAGIVGGAGYVGGEMCRLLLLHPNVELTFVQSTSNANNPLWKVHEDLFGDTDMLFSDSIVDDVDVLFLCMGHGKSIEFFKNNKINDNVVVIDLGNDFRLNENSSLGEREFAYGLVDFFGQSSVMHRNVANPGCFATAIQLAVLPLASHNLLCDDIHITAVTGSTGAGQSLSSTTHFSWRANNLSTYKTFSHQHLGEIGQSVSKLQPEFGNAINFVPYRGDFQRGIIATIHTKTSKSIEELKEIYNNCYSSSEFTFVSDKPVNLKQVVNTNKALISIEKHGDYVLITSVIDNLLRGAAGQAIENMNMIFELPARAGLQLKSSAF